jgi:hypothetical protein
LHRAAPGRKAGCGDRLDGQVRVSDLENKIVDECLQLFGGYGYMDEYPIKPLCTATAASQRI